VGGAAAAPGAALTSSRTSLLSRLPPRLLAAVGAAAVLVLLAVVLLLTQGPRDAAPGDAGAPPVATGPDPVPPATCAVSAVLVNPCRAWLGTAVGGYPQVAPDQAAQLAYAERRLSDPRALTDPALTPAAPRQFDVVRLYHQSAQVTFSPSELSYVDRPGTYAFVSWKPDTTWARAGGGDAEVNARIDAFAASVRALGPHKIFLSVFHEPENDVSEDSCAPPAAAAAAGSPADYVAMWRNVRARFDAAGVSNVVWVMNYMGYQAWDCLVPQLWPGNALVDWVTWDPYAAGGDFGESVGRFYDRLEATSDAEHDYAGRPWGLSEMGSDTSQDVAAGYWDGARRAHAERFPRIRLWSVFDTSVNGGDNGGLRVGYDDAGAPAPAEQAAFSAFGQAVLGPPPAGGG